MSYKGSKKKCPFNSWSCEKEKCAWWLVHSKQCAVPLIASRLADISKIIQEPTAVNIGPPIPTTKQVQPGWEQ